MTAKSDHYPIGATLMFAGDLPEDSDWLLCDGREFEVKSYPELFLAIGYIYSGENTNKSVFNIPDYLGQFLRGASHESDNDPDKSTRTSLGSRNDLDADGDIGSLQTYATKIPNGKGFSASFDHLPVGSKTTHGITKGSNIGYASEASKLQKTCTSGGDHETRPKNVYLNLYIKASIESIKIKQQKLGIS